ncbi:MAG: asparagine synthase (glutamine-hydrolyzing) [Bacteroidales bacterium]|jgi:asparagine synthase (glutamine-hydrolysing)
MCGIFGYLSYNNDAKIFEDRLKNAVKTLENRGPDYSGIFIHNNVGLGHTRLAVIDTSQAGSQPFFDSQKKYVLIFNGEFYNFKDYIDELKNDGVKFISRSDTEVLLYLLIKYREKAIEKINGCFAFAFYDLQKQELLLARDRMGINPLVFYKDDNFFVFGSELKSLLAFGIQKKINYSALNFYFKLNYLPTEISILDNVFKLNPGHFLIVNKEGIKKQKYYQIPIPVENEYETDYKSSAKKLRELLSESVKRRLISDVPICTFLSGGIDSSIITAIASQYTKDLNTFSIGFKNEEFYDETKYAELLSKRYKTNHTAFLIQPKDMLEDVFKVLEYLDEPFGDSSSIAVYRLSKLVRQKATVALSGDGADEMFAGYNKHSAHFMAKYAGSKEKLTALLNPLWKNLPKSRSSKYTNYIRQLNRFAEGFKLSPEERYFYWASIGYDDYVNNLLAVSSDYQILNKIISKYNSLSNNSDDLNFVLYKDMHLVLQGDMLTKVDLMSMANSLEVRTPFLDHTVVDFVFRLPSYFKITANNRKKILKDAFSDLLPEDIVSRPKHGFEVPLKSWLKKELWTLIDDDLLNEDFIYDQKIFNYNVIKTLKKQVLSKNPEDSPAKIWALVVFQYWWKKYYC